MSMLCLNCKNERFTEKLADVPQTFRGENFTVKADAMVCTECTWFTMNDAQADHLCSLTANEYRRRHGLLTSAEIIACRKKRGLSQVCADTMTLLIRRGIPDADEILIKSRPEDSFISVSRKHTLSTEECVFKGFKNLATKALVQKTQRASKPLQLVAKSTSGFGGKSALITTERLHNRQMPVLKGASIQRYAMVGDCYFDFRPENLSGRTRDIRKLGIKEKVLLRKTGDRIIAAFDDSGRYPEQSLYFLYDVAPSVNPKTLLGLLNSNLLSWFYINYLVTNLDSTPQLKNCDLDIMPIFLPVDQRPIIGLVDKVLSAKKRNQNADTLTVERELDLLVYSLYGLTPEEIKLVEAAS